MIEISDSFSLLGDWLLSELMLFSLSFGGGEGI